MKLKKVFKKAAAALTAFTCAFGIFCGGRTGGSNSVIDSDISLTANAATTYNVTFPVNNGCKIAYYQKYDPKYKNHDGVDIHSSGNDTIYAAKAGEVVGIGNSCPHSNQLAEHDPDSPKYKNYGESGNYIKIKGNDGVYYWYYHLLQNSMLVKKGDKVVAGQAIAKMGSSGMSSGKHLHFKMTTGTGYYSTAIIANPVGTYSGQVNYSNGPYNTTVAKVIVRFHRNTSSSDTTAVSETFTAGVANQKFGYNTNGTGKYSSMNSADVGFGQWTKSGYKMLGWSKSKSATTASWATYSSVVDSWIKSNSPYVDLYAVWKQDNTITSLSIASPATYTIYPTNGKLDTTGLTLTAKYSDGSSKTITSGFTASADLSKEGAATVTVNYNNSKTTYDVKVENYFSGVGTEESPYLISSASDLKLLSNVVNDLSISPYYKTAHYKQTADINLGGSLFEPIGVFKIDDIFYQTLAFDGVYDGDKHKITNLFVNTSKYYAGLFGRTNSHAEIKNLSVYGNITCSNYCTGGIVGEVGYGGKIINCSFSGTVTGAQWAGGITSGLRGGGTISGCYVNADIKTGLSGENAFAGGITGRSNVGCASTSVNAVISNNYFVGTVTGGLTGGIVGKTIIESVKDNTSTCTNNYFLKADGLEASGDGSVSPSNGKALSENLLRSADELLGSPFSYNWNKNLNDGYPVFEWQVIPQGDANNDNKVNVADMVMLQKWLMGSGELTAWQNVDLCDDGIIDTFDMILMRKLLIESGSLSAQ